MSGAELSAVLRAKNEAESELNAFHRGIEQVDQGFGRIPASAAAAGLAITGVLAGMVALTKAAYDLGASFDDAMDTIVIKTGASGASLEQLQQDFEAVFASVPDSAEKVASALGSLSTRTGQTGEGLQQLTEQMLTLSRITKTDADANVRATTRAFGDWGIATEDQGLALDKLFVAAQRAGTTTEQLAQTITQAGAPLRALGLSFDEAAAMAAKFEREGVNTETVLAAMRQSVARLAEAGLDPAQTFQRLVTTIREMEDPIEATALSMEVFGKKGGTDMAAAIREGRFALDEYLGAIEGAGGAIKDAADKTDDAQKQMQTAWKELQTAAAPVVTTVFEAANAAMTAAIPLMQRFATNLRTVAEAFKAMKEGRVTWNEVAAAALGVETRPESVGAGDIRGSYRPPGMAEAGLTMGGPESAPSPAEPPPPAPGLSAEEIAALRKDTEAQQAASRAARDEAREAAREAAQAQREQAAAQRDAQREQAAAVREAERLLEEQRRQAEREAEAEARRTNQIRELGQRRAAAIDEAEQVAHDAKERAKERAIEQEADLLAQIERDRSLADERKRLQDDINAQVEAAREAQAGQRQSVSDARSEEDIARRRLREDQDLLDRRAGSARGNADAERREQEAIRAAQFGGDSRAVTAAMLAAERARNARRDQLADEEESLQRRRARETEDITLARRRRQEDVDAQKRNAAELKQVIEEASKPLEDFNKRILEDNLDKKILDFYKARDALISAADQRLTDTRSRADTQFDEGVRRANEQGLSQTVILNNYNSGLQGPDAVEEMIDDLLEEAARRLAHTG